jgi:hypothetical protein
LDTGRAALAVQAITLGAGMAARSPSLRSAPPAADCARRSRLTLPLLIVRMLTTEDAEFRT